VEPTDGPKAGARSAAPHLSFWAPLVAAAGVVATAAAVGVAAGFGALGFAAATRAIHENLVGPGDTFLEAIQALPWWRRIIIPALGGVMAALLLSRLLPGRSTLGVSGIMEAVVLRRGPVRFRDAFVRVLGSLGVIGTGGSVGREGPIVELGAAVGSKVGVALGRAEAVPLYIACGAAAGMAAAYRAPLGASVFVLEVMLGTFAVRRLVPVVVASVAAVTVVRAVAGDQPVYIIPRELGLERWWELSLAALLGVIGGFVGPLFLRTLAWGEESFARLPPSPAIRGAVGGIFVGALGASFPEVWGNGYDAVNLILAGRMGLLLMAALFILKPLATSVTVGSGGIGGVFTPTLFLGASMGGLLGTAVHGFAPGATALPAAYALLGMAAAIGATTHAPVTAVLLLFELTMDYKLVPGLMLASVLATLIARGIHPGSHYTQRLQRRGIHMPRGPAEAALLTVPASAAMVPADRIVGAADTVGEVLRRLREGAGDVYVVETDGRLKGRVRAEDLVGIPAQELAGVPAAGDLARPAPWIVGDATLAEALAILEASGRPEVPVLAADGKVAGILTLRAVVERLRGDADA
jgi:chloride channel protein, CIC family